MTHQRGFSLIEALIALLVLSIGLIGVAAMQLKALQSANGGYQRSIASVAAVDAQERLWAALADLEVGQTCDDIDVTAVQNVWKAHWFQSTSNATPLRSADEARSNISPMDGDGCRLRVDVAVEGSDENSDPFDYTFSLPRIVRVESTP